MPQLLRGIVGEEMSMSEESENAPAWLFAFVDLAFLSLMAMTQITSDAIPGLDLGEMVVPHVGSEVVSELAAGSTDRWQLRVCTRWIPKARVPLSWYTRSARPYRTGRDVSISRSFASACNRFGPR